MKKFVFALMAIFAFGMISCNQNKTVPDANVSDSTIALVDSVAVDSTLVDTVSVDSVITL